MARDIKKEKEWAKAKYTRILGDIDKELGDELKEKLKKENKSIAGWITENAKKYLKKNKKSIDLLVWVWINIFKLREKGIDYYGKNNLLYSRKWNKKFRMRSKRYGS